VPRDGEPAGALDRQRLLELFYEAELRELRPSALLGPADRAFVRTRVNAFEARQADVDALLRRHLAGWSLERLAPVDRALLRIATTELLAGLTPAPIAIAEAVKLADRYSTERSAGFVNGVLAAVLEDLRATTTTRDNTANPSRAR